MHEIEAADVQHLIDGDRVLYASLVWAPKQPAFHAARKSLRRLGASYDHELRAWRIPVCEDALEPLRCLYRMSSLALYVAEDGEEVTRDSFTRYL